MTYVTACLQRFQPETSDRTSKEIFTYKKHENNIFKNTIAITCANIWITLSLEIRHCNSIHVFKACYLNNIFDSDARDHKHLKLTILVNLLILCFFITHIFLKLLNKHGINLELTKGAWFYLSCRETMCIIICYTWT